MTAIEAIDQAIEKFEQKLERLKQARAILTGDDESPLDLPRRNPQAPKVRARKPAGRTVVPPLANGTTPNPTKPAKQESAPRGLAGSNIAKVLKFLDSQVMATTEVIIQKTGLTRDEFESVCRNHSERLQRNQKGVSTSPWQLTATGKADAAKLPKDWE